jgi:uncharacterized membrane protein
MATEREQRATPAAKDTGRLESFSDGVFAVAITLLVLNLVVPGRAPNSWQLAAALGHEWPQYLAFVTSFCTVLIMWLNHHVIFRMAQRSDSALMFANGFLLLIVTVVPFVTALVARYLGTPAAPTAAAVYAGAFAIGNIAYNLLWWSIIHQRRLLHPHASPRQMRKLTISFLAGFPIYLVATALAFWNAYASIAVCFCLWIVWAMTGYERPTEHETLPKRNSGQEDGMTTHHSVES